MGQIIIRGMTRPLRWAIAALACAGGSAQALDATDRLARTVALSHGQVIRVDATVADVTILGSNRSDVAVEIVRHAPTPADLARYPAAIDETTDGIHIGAVQEADGRDARLKTEIVVRAPAAAAFEAVRVFEGRVRVSGLTEACDVDVRRGPIEATALAGRVRLESGTGSVDVRDSTLTPGGMMRLRVFNGPVRVNFARVPASARILAVTFNGAIKSDIPLTMKETFGPRFGEATIGGGDPVLSLDVVTGDIAITVGKP
jgi:hypothetical protein